MENRSLVSRLIDGPELPSVPDDSTRKQDTLSQRDDIVGRSLYETLPTKSVGSIGQFTRGIEKVRY